MVLVTEKSLLADRYGRLGQLGTPTVMLEIALCWRRDEDARAVRVSNGWSRAESLCEVGTLFEPRRIVVGMRHCLRWRGGDQFVGRAEATSMIALRSCVRGSWSAIE